MVGERRAHEGVFVSARHLEPELRVALHGFGDEQSSEVESSSCTLVDQDL